MSYEEKKFLIQKSSTFKKEYKAIQKKYPKSLNEIDNVIKELEKGNLLGDEYSNVGFDDDEKIMSLLKNSLKLRRCWIRKSGEFVNLN